MSKRGKSAREVRRAEEKERREDLKAMAGSPAVMSAMKYRMGMGFMSTGDFTDRFRGAERMNRLGTITEEDLKREKKFSYDEGWHVGCQFTTHAVFAMVALTLKDQLGFGQKRVIRFLEALDRRCISADELSGADEVMEELHLTMNWKDPFQRVTETEQQ